MSREGTRKIFTQNVQTLYLSTSDTLNETLEQELEVRTCEKELEDSECIAAAKVVKDSIDEAFDFLSFNDTLSDLSRGYTSAYTGAYKAELASIGTSDAIQVLDALQGTFHKRKLVLKKMRKQFRRPILEDIADLISTPRLKFHHSLQNSRSVTR